MFEKSLQDVIQGLRKSRDEEEFLKACLKDCREEIISTDMDIKAQALSKLIYLQMWGCEISWASFQVVEVMSNAKFAIKSIGYLAASKCFQQDMPVLTLTTNLLKKDLYSTRHLEAGLALSGLADFVTPELGRDLAADLQGLVSSSKPYVRKKAILALYKVFIRYPDALKPCFPKIRERLEDPDPSVASAAVNVICELARRNPSQYQPLAPQLFRLLSTSSNNWMLIKIIKLFGAMAAEEPRLAKKLQLPFKNLMETTHAMSLLYECVKACIHGGMLHINSSHSIELHQLCQDKLFQMMESFDPNLKYVSLIALRDLLQLEQPHELPRVEQIMGLIEDADLSIRIRAMDVLPFLVNSENLISIVDRIMLQIIPFKLLSTANSRNSMDPVFRTSIADQLLNLLDGQADGYAKVTEFEWLVECLTEIASIDGLRDLGSKIASLLKDLVLRVVELRPFMVDHLEGFICFYAQSLDSAITDNCMKETLAAAAWICGEYHYHLSSHQQMLFVLSNPGKFITQDAQTLRYFLQASLKVYAGLVSQISLVGFQQSLEEFSHSTQVFAKNLNKFVAHVDVEVSNRSLEFIQLLSVVEAKMYTAENETVQELQRIAFGDREAYRVAQGALESVPIIEGLNLDQWFGKSYKTGTSFVYSWDFWMGPGFWGLSEPPSPASSSTLSVKETTIVNTKSPEVEQQELNARKMKLREKKKNSPFYLPDSNEKLSSVKRTTLSIDNSGIILESTSATSSLAASAEPVLSVTREKLRKKVRHPMVVDRSQGLAPKEGKENLLLTQKSKKTSSEKSNTKKIVLEHDVSALQKVDLTLPVIPVVTTSSTLQQATGPIEPRMEEETLAKPSLRSNIQPTTDELVVIPRTRKKKKPKKIKSEDLDPPVIVLDIPPPPPPQVVTTTSLPENTVIAKITEQVETKQDLPPTAPQVSVGKELAKDYNLILSYSLTLKKPPVKSPFIQPEFRLELVLKGCSEEDGIITNMEYTFAQSPDYRVEGGLCHSLEGNLEAPLSTTTLTLILVLKYQSEVDIEGALNYLRQSETSKSFHQLDFSLQIKAWDLLMKPESVLMEDEAQYRRTTQIALPVEFSRLSFQRQAQALFNLMRLEVIQTDESQANAFAQSIYGYFVFVRLVPTGDELRIEVRCSDEEFAQITCQQVKNIF